MSMNRRTMLKGLAFSPALSTLSSCRSPVTRAETGGSSGTASSDGSCYVNMLFHGGLFVEFQQKHILVKAPAVLMHRYAFGSRGCLAELARPAISEPPKPVVPFDMDLTSEISGLAQGGVKSFADYPAIPQFSATETKVGSMTGPYRWQIALPFPEEVIPLRLGNLADFNRAIVDGKIKQSVMKSCSRNGNDKLALVICLRYRMQPEYCSASLATTTYNFHADHECEPSTAEMNQTLKQMGTIFQDSGNFDLQVNDTGVPEVKRDPDNLQTGIAGDDEKSLAEILYPATLVPKCSITRPNGFLSRVTSCLALSTGGRK